MKTINKTKAFTLLEILLVIALAIGIFAISAPLGLRMYRTQLVEDTTSNIIDALERARHYAILQKYDSSFGVTLSEVSDSYVLFAGPDYANRDQTKDEVYPVISQITFSGLTDIVFASLTGTSSTTGTIIISYGDDIVREILIDNSGLIYKRTPPWWELDDSLVGFWTSVKSGSISALGPWLDYSGNDNDGLLAGNAYVDSDGLQLDGSGDYANIENEELFETETNGTICTWFNVKENSPGQGIVSDRRSSDDKWWTGLWLGNGNKITFGCKTDLTEYALILGTSWTINNWIFSCGTWDNSGIYKYFNGVLDESSTVKFCNFTKSNIFNPRIGWYFQNDFSFNGIINDVMVFNRALTSDEIAEIFNGQKAKYGY